MDKIILNYYFFKKVIDKLDDNIKSNLRYDEDLLLNLSNFKSSPLFFDIYKLKNDRKYNMYENFHSELFDEFLIECAINLEKENSYKKLLLFYGMLAHHVLESHIDPYLNALKSDDYDIRYAENMIDYYYSKKLELDIIKKPLNDKFPQAFLYLDYMDELIHNPMIKVFKLMSSKNYFKKCYKKLRRFYSSSKMSLIKRMNYPLWDLFRKNKIKAKSFYYRDDIDTKLLNMEKNEYQIGENTYNYSLDEVINIALDDVLERINAFNLYLFETNDKKLRKLYNIDELKKM